MHLHELFLRYHFQTSNVWGGNQGGGGGGNFNQGGFGGGGGGGGGNNAWGGGFGGGYGGGYGRWRAKALIEIPYVALDLRMCTYEGHFSTRFFEVFLQALLKSTLRTMKLVPCIINIFHDVLSTLKLRKSTPSPCFVPHIPKDYWKIQPFLPCVPNLCGVFSH